MGRREIYFPDSSGWRPHFGGVTFFLPFAGGLFASRKLGIGILLTVSGDRSLQAGISGVRVRDEYFPPRLALIALPPGGRYLHFPIAGIYILLRGSSRVGASPADT